MRSSEAHQGFTYLTVLVFVALTGLGLATVAESWSHARQREKEAELLWVGNQFIQAIGLYYERSPGAIKRYPESLDDLLEDRRFLSKQRYLRRIYADPMTGKADWDLVEAPGGGIVGIRSRSTSRAVGRMARVSGYSQWDFTYSPVPAVRK